LRLLRSRVSGGFLFVERPFFEVDVELTIPNVSMNPSLEDIQDAINTTAKKVLACSKELKAWSAEHSSADSPDTFFDHLASDKEIVKSVLLLTGSIEGTKTQVLGYVATFDKYNFLWKHDMQAEYSEFMKTQPTLEAFEGELRKYMAIETVGARLLVAWLRFRYVRATCFPSFRCLMNERHGHRNGKLLGLSPAVFLRL
jgi:dynein heavy chain